MDAGRPARRFGGGTRVRLLVALSGLGAAGCLELAGDFIVVDIDAAGIDDAGVEPLAPVFDSAILPDAGAEQDSQDSGSDRATDRDGGSCNGGLEACATCVSGQVQCSGTTLQTCDAAHGNWIPLQTCATAALCDAAGRTCHPPACAAGEYRCVGASLEQCNAGRTGWAAASLCATAALCDAKGGQCATPACSPGEYLCNHTGNTGATLEPCNAGRTGYGPPTARCLSALLCDQDAGRCDVCAPGSWSCSGADLHHCADDGQSNPVAQTCGSPAQCDAPAQSCDACVAGKHPCSAVPDAGASDAHGDATATATAPAADDGGG